MNGTLANRILTGFAVALACTMGSSAWALASAGGTSAPTGKRAAKTTSLHGTQIATWFGPGFYGQQTACGQTMTPAIVGVASRTLPCGTLVLVDYGGHRLTVPVIDRGPYAHNGATWDLTWGAANALTINDTVRVRTRIVGRAPNTPLLGVPTEAQPAGASAVTPSGGTAAG